MPDLLTRKLAERTDYNEPNVPEYKMYPRVADPQDFAKKDRLTRRLAEREEENKGFLRRAGNLMGGILKTGGKGLWKGLGIVTWPFERIEYAIATPLTAFAKAAGESRGEEIEFATKVLGGAIPKEEILPEAKTLFRQQAKKTLPVFAEAGKSMGPALKSFIPWRETPKGVKTFNDFWGAYYKGMTGLEAPEWYKQTSGIGTSLLVVPKIFSKLLKITGEAARALPFVKKAQAARLPMWQRAKLRTRMKIGARTERAAELGKTLAKKDIKRLAKEMSKKTGKPVSEKAVKLRLAQVIRGGITEEEGMRQIANPVIAEFMKTSKELKRLGILPAETYLTKLPKKRITELLKHKDELQSQLSKLKGKTFLSGKTGKTVKHRFPGRANKIRKLESQIQGITDKVQASYKTGGTEYFPRLYTVKEEAARKAPLFSKQKVRAQYAKKRQKIPFEVRKAMGEIKEPAYPVIKRLIQTGSDIETAKLFHFAAKHPKWVSSAWQKGLVKTALPNTKMYGTLRGKYVAPQIYKDVTELMRIRGNFEAYYDTLIGGWKAGKVIWNPATHFRNIFSNSILLDLSGMDHIQQSKYMVQAIKEIKAGSKEYQVAKRYFARTTLIRGELLDDMLRGVKESQGSGLDKTINLIPKLVGKGKISGKPAQIYQTEEFLGKFMKYLQQRDKGKSVIKAVEEANKWLFDYGELTKWEKLIARRAMPFYTFPRKALPRVAEAAANNPYALAKYPLLAKMTTQYSLHKLDLTEKDYEQLKKTLPEYMQRGSYVLMPWRDENGDLRFFDWTYVVPWGEIYDAHERGILKAGITNPMVQIWADLSRNKSGWTDREIYKETDTTSEKTYKALEYTWQSIMPSLAYKGIYWNKLEEAATGKPSKRGKTRPLSETIAHTVFGLRTQPIDVDEQKMFKIWDKQSRMQELESKMRDITVRFGAGNIDKEEYQKKRDQYLGQAQKLIAE